MKSLSSPPIVSLSLVGAASLAMLVMLTAAAAETLGFYRAFWAAILLLLNGGWTVYYATVRKAPVGDCK
jgi:hypothetical protein